MGPFSKGGSGWNGFGFTRKHWRPAPCTFTDRIEQIDDVPAGFPTHTSSWSARSGNDQQRRAVPVSLGLARRPRPTLADVPRPSWVGVPAPRDYALGLGVARPR